MREYGLADAVSSFSDYSSTIANLWGIYVVATFTAAGFGITLQDQFTPSLAALLSAGFLAFTIGHLYLLHFAICIQRDLQKDIIAYLTTAEDGLAAMEVTPESASAGSASDKVPFAASIRSICRHRSKLWASILAHIVIDGCVLMIIWSMATGFDPLNLVAG